MRLTRITPPDFDFGMAVQSHGFFALAPNHWDPSSRRLRTTVHTSAGPLHVCVRHCRAGAKGRLHIDVPGLAALSAEVRTTVRTAVGRVLRLDENLGDFHRLCSREPALQAAVERRFGRLIRSQSLFEDLVKTMCTCNITWRQTVAMVRRLVEACGTPALNQPAERAFPTPVQLASVPAADLRTRCGLGYRADWVCELAGQVAAGRRNLDTLESPNLPTDELYRQLRTVRGIGDYAASSLCVLLGRYDRPAVDTEMIQHYRRRFPRRTATPANIRKHYARYAPYSALVYWWELWSHYAGTDGHPDSWA